MSKINGHTPLDGHSWKLCPHSTQYGTAYYDLGFDGPSTNTGLPVPTSAHPDTEGTMRTAMKGSVWGFMCMDDNCYFFITYGRRYFEA